MNEMLQYWSWSAVGAGSLVPQDRVSVLALCNRQTNERTNERVTKTTVS